MELRKNEQFFTELAKAYVEQEAAALQIEAAEIEAANMLLPTAGLDRKIKSALLKQKIRKYSVRSLPLVASLVFALLIYNGMQSAPPAHVAEAPAPSAPVVVDYPASTPVYMAPSPATQTALLSSVELVKANLPEGYTLTGVDYDNAAAIMEITNENSNLIVVTAEAYRDFDKDGFTVIKANGAVAYGMVKNDYCVLKYGKDDMLYTMTCMYDYGDLIELFENI